MLFQSVPFLVMQVLFSNTKLSISKLFILIKINMEYIKKQEKSKIIQGEFSLKNLGYFIKCTNLCSQIEMYLENDLPLVVKYNVASLGTIKLCLSNLQSNS